MKVFIRLLLFLLPISIIACAASHNVLNPNEPHYYQNSYEEVVDGVDQSLNQASMKVYKSDHIDDGTYYVKYYKDKYDMRDVNPDAALMAEITIEKSDGDYTKLTIDEEKQSSMVPSEQREHLGRDVLRELNEILNHKEDSEASANEG